MFRRCSVRSPVRNAPLRRWLAGGLLLLALQQLGSAALIQAKAYLAQHLIARAWARVGEGSVAPRPWPWADTWPVARLRVPAAGVDQYVLAGIGGNALAFGPGLDPGAERPGAAGTAVIAGHRDTHFRFLRHLVPGQRVLLQLADGVGLDYVVEETAVVDSRRASLPPVADESRLLLVTCYPFDALRPGGPLRYVVRATLRNPYQITNRPSPLTGVYPL